MDCTIPIPLAAQVAALAANWREWANAHGVTARAIAERQTRALEQHVRLWLTELASAARPLGMSDMRARHGVSGVTKSQLARSIAVALDRGHAKVARRGPKNAAFYVITSAGRSAAADLDQHLKEGALQ